VFVCRDFSKKHKEDVVEKKLRNNLDKIWEKTQNPQSIYDWFDVYFSFLPSALDFEDEFTEK